MTATPLCPAWLARLGAGLAGGGRRACLVVLLVVTGPGTAFAQTSPATAGQAGTAQAGTGQVGPGLTVKTPEAGAPATKSASLGKGGSFTVSPSGNRDESPDYKQWEGIAERSEQTLTNPDTPQAALEFLRAQLVDWRAAFLSQACGGDAELRVGTRQRQDHPQACRDQEPGHAGDDHGVPRGAAELARIQYQGVRLHKWAALDREGTAGSYYAAQRAARGIAVNQVVSAVRVDVTVNHHGALADLSRDLLGVVVHRSGVFISALRVIISPNRASRLR